MSKSKEPETLGELASQKGDMGQVEILAKLAHTLGFINCCIESYSTVDEDFSWNGNAIPPLEPRKGPQYALENYRIVSKSIYESENLLERLPNDSFTQEIREILVLINNLLGQADQPAELALGNNEPDEAINCISSAFYKCYTYLYAKIQILSANLLLKAQDYPNAENQDSGAVPKTKSTRKRATKQEIHNRNRAVLAAALELQREYGRLPTVQEISDKTGYDIKDIYNTPAYKEGKRIARASAKLTTESTGGSVIDSEFYDGKTVQGSRSRRRSEAEQIELDHWTEDQKKDDDSDFVR